MSLPHCMHSTLGGGMRTSISRLRSGMANVTAATLQRVAVARGRDPITWLIICGCLLVAAIALGTTMMVGEFRERAIVNSERELQNAVLLLTRHFDQQLEDTEIVAADVIAQMKLSQIASPEAFDQKMSSPEAHQMLAAKVSKLSYIGEVLVFDAAGQLINSSGSWPVRSVNITDRAYFMRFKTDPQAPEVVAEPVL